MVTVVTVVTPKGKLAGWPKRGTKIGWNYEQSRHQYGGEHPTLLVERFNCTDPSQASLPRHSRIVWLKEMWGPYKKGP